MIYTLDFETYYDREYSLSRMTQTEYIRDPRFRVLGLAVKPFGKEATWIPEKKVEPFLLAYGKKLCSGSWLMHHAHFDGAILSWKYGLRPVLYLDTLSMARASLPLGSRLSLEALADRWNLGKKAELHYGSTDDELEVRGTRDCDLTEGVFGKLMPGFPPHELKVIDLTVRLYTEPSFVGDPAKMWLLINKLVAQKEKLLEDAGVTRDILMSNNKLAEALKNYGVDIPTKTSKSTGGETYAFAKNDPAFVSLLDHENPVVQSIVAARLGVKSTGDETRARRYHWMATHGGTLPVYLSYYAAHPGRWGGGDKTNFQNLRRGGVLRDTLLAPAGCRLVIGDFSQIQARINFWRAGDAAALDAFRQRRDIYCDFGAEVYERKITKKDVVERFVSKTGVLGLGFGCGHERLRDEVRAKGGYEISDALARKVVDIFRVRMYPKVPAYWRELERYLTWDIDDGVIRSVGGDLFRPSGMRLQYPQLERTRDGWKYFNGRKWVKLWGGVLAENVAMALERDIVAEKAVELSKEFKVATLTHDDIVLCVPEKQVDEAATVMEQVMSYSHGWYTDLPLACEIAVGDNYGVKK